MSNPNQIHSPSTYNILKILNDLHILELGKINNITKDSNSQTLIYQTTLISQTTIKQKKQNQLQINCLANNNQHYQINDEVFIFFTDNCYDNYLKYNNTIPIANSSFNKHTYNNGIILCKKNIVDKDNEDVWFDFNKDGFFVFSKTKPIKLESDNLILIIEDKTFSLQSKDNKLSINIDDDKIEINYNNALLTLDNDITIKNNQTEIKLPFTGFISIKNGTSSLADLLTTTLSTLLSTGTTPPGGGAVTFAGLPTFITEVKKLLQ